VTPRRLLRRLAALFQHARLDSELDEEILAHLELAERDARAAGLSVEEARLAARRLFGGVEQIKEHHRDARGIRWLDALARDARYGIAALWRDPLFTSVVVGVLALGIGANAAMFSLLDAVLLKPLPFLAPDRIVRIWEAPQPGATNSTSTLDFLDWQRLGSTFDAMAAEVPAAMALNRGGDPVQLDAGRVTADYFRVFAVEPALGRTFSAADAIPGAAPVVILSHAVWRTYFGSDPAILQQRPLFDGEPRQVIGVLPPGVFDQAQPAVWTPLIFTADEVRRDWHWLSVSGRLRPGVPASRARDQLRAIRAAQGDVTPIFKRKWSIEVEPLERLLVDDTMRRSLLIAAGAVLIVLLIACANVANLLLARGTTRTKEMAIRAALGAGRGRLVAQLLTETMALAFLGGAAGVALAYWMVAAARPALHDFLPASAVVSLDRRVLAFTLVAAIAAAVLAGVFPAIHTSRRGIASSANGLGRGAPASGGRIRRTIVAAEVAMSIVLVCGALLLFMSLGNLVRLDAGVRIDGVVTASLDLPAATYSTPERTAQFSDLLVERLDGVPGIRRAALATVLPLRWIGNGESIWIRGVEAPVKVRFKRVSSGYFDALDIAMAAGRGITPRDRQGSPPVVILNQALASQIAAVAHIDTPVGMTVRLRYTNFGKEIDGDAEVVGVIRSERVGDPWRPDPPVLYVPLAQAPYDRLKLVVRTDAGPAAVLPDIRAALRAIDPNLPIGSVATMAQVRDRTYLFASRPAWAIGGFAAVAVLLAALGLYGVLAQSVSQQRREIGIRLALGAAPRSVMWATVGGALRTIAVGTAAGLAGAGVVAPVIRELLFGVSALDPRVLAGAVSAMAGIGVAAALIPARRAARVDPIVVLRSD
jgi:putative ABC transport system permease protein